MAKQPIIQQKAFKGIEVFCQCHFIKLGVNAVMALPTNINAGTQLLAVVRFLKKSAPVHFLRDQVVKCEVSTALAQRAITSPGTAAAVG
ncbi:MAG: hypothetical protein V7708_06005 [Oceanicoccus sp.]